MPAGGVVTPGGSRITKFPPPPRPALGPAIGIPALPVEANAPTPDHTPGASSTATIPSTMATRFALRSTKTRIAATATPRTAHRSQPFHAVSREISTHAHAAATATLPGSTSQLSPTGSRYILTAHTVPTP